MERRIRKNETRKMLSKTNRQARLMMQYVQVKYPDAYNDAEACYETLNAKYPNKRDLTKTIEFVQLNTGATTYAQYYSYRKQQKREQEKKQAQATETTTTARNDMFDLRIPLLSPEIVENNRSLNIPEYPEVMTEIVADPDLRTVFNQLTTPDGETMDTCSSENNTAGPENLNDLVEQLSSENLNDLVDQLIKDPLLDEVFNNNIYDENLNDLVDQACNNMLTPLEMDLLNK